MMNNAIKLCRFLAVLLACVWGFSAEAGAELKVHFIDVGQGDAILIQCDGANLLVDAGPEDAGAAVHAYLTETACVRKLDYVIATHEHDDHLGGMPKACEGMEIGTVYTGAAIPTKYWIEKIYPYVAGKGFSVLKPQGGEFFWLENAKVTFLNTLAQAENANDMSLVVRIDYGNNSVLLMADMEGDGENSLLEKGAPLRADILKVGHHGGNTSTGDAFLKAVQPQIAIISVGNGNKHGHPHSETLNKLKKYDIPVYRSDQLGTITATSDGEAWTVEVSKTR